MITATPQQLRHAADLQEQIEELRNELNDLFGSRPKDVNREAEMDRPTRPSSNDLLNAFLSVTVAT